MADTAVVEFAGSHLHFTLPDGTQVTDSMHTSTPSSQLVATTIGQHVAAGQRIVVVSPCADGDCLRLGRGADAWHITAHGINKPGSTGIQLIKPIQAVATWLATGSRPFIPLNGLAHASMPEPESRIALVHVAEWDDRVVVMAGLATKGHVFHPVSVTDARELMFDDTEKHGLAHIVKRTIVNTMAERPAAEVAVHITWYTAEPRLVHTLAETLKAEPLATTTRPMRLFVDQYAVAAGAVLVPQPAIR